MDLELMITAPYLVFTVRAISFPSLSIPVLLLAHGEVFLLFSFWRHRSFRFLAAGPVLILAHNTALSIRGKNYADSSRFASKNINAEAAAKVLV
jgi:hypothetical protein